jgi:hypothetical protein
MLWCFGAEKVETVQVSVDQAGDRVRGDANAVVDVRTGPEGRVWRVSAKVKDVDGCRQTMC